MASEQAGGLEALQRECLNRQVWADGDYWLQFASALAPHIAAAKEREVRLEHFYKALETIANGEWVLDSSAQELAKQALVSQP